MADICRLNMFCPFQPCAHFRDMEASRTPLSEAEFEEIMNRNRAISSSAISRAVSDASAGNLHIYTCKYLIVVPVFYENINFNVTLCLPQLTMAVP